MNCLRRKLYFFTATVFSIMFLTGNPLKAADKIFINASVLTMDEQNTIARAVAIKHGRIVCVGSNEEVSKHKKFFTQVIDLEGKTIIPGFVDAHSHFPGSGLDQVMADLNSPPIGSVHNIDELKAALRKRAATVGKDGWIVGFGYDDTLLAEKRHPTRTDLDEISVTNPVFIVHISGHLAVVNSKVMEILGINKDSPNPEGGTIRRDPETGLPNGVLEEEAMELVTAVMPLPAFPKLLAMMRDSIQDYVSTGVTTAQNGYAEKSYCTILGLLSKLGIFPLRIVVWPREEVGHQIVEGNFRWGDLLNTNKFELGAVKLLADGSIQGYTGYLSEPYHVPLSPDDPQYRGYPRLTREQLIDEISYFHRAGLQIAVHGNGDASIDDILFAFERAQEEFPRSDARHIIIHAQMARDDQLDRMKALGVIPSFFSLHTYYWGDRHMNIFMGPDRARRMSPARSALDRDLLFTIHTDTPVVPMDPLLLVWSAVNRLSHAGNPIGEKQRIDTMQALRAVTINAAKQMFLEDTRGSIEAGKFADLVILSANPLDDPKEIRNIKVLETIVGGKTVYAAGRFDE